jgi:hypothetical protein
MKKETDLFLYNECMKAILGLVSKYPNDMDLGKRVREFVKNDCTDPNQLKLHYDQNRINYPDNEL